MSFFGRLTASIQLIKESWNILKKDKELLLYPLVSGITILLLLGIVFVPTLLLVMSGELGVGSFFFAFILFYFLAAIIGVFFTASLIGAADMRLNGKDPKFSDGIKIAAKNFPKLLGWGILNATVGVVLSAVSEGDNVISKIVSYIISIAWTLLTLFTIPVMLFEKKGIFGSIKRSAEIFKKTWGESVVGQFSIGALFAVGLVFGVLLVIGALLTGSFILFLAVFAIVMVALILLYLVTSALNGIYITALYNYATKKKLPKGFSKEFIKSAFVRK